MVRPDERRDGEQVDSFHFLGSTKELWVGFWIQMKNRYEIILLNKL